MYVNEPYFNLVFQKKHLVKDVSTTFKWIKYHYTQTLPQANEISIFNLKLTMNSLKQNLLLVYANY